MVKVHPHQLNTNTYHTLLSLRQYYWSFQEFHTIEFQAWTSLWSSACNETTRLDGAVWSNKLNYNYDHFWSRWQLTLFTLAGLLIISNVLQHFLTSSKFNWKSNNLYLELFSFLFQYVCSFVASNLSPYWFLCIKAKKSPLSWTKMFKQFKTI